MAQLDASVISQIPDYAGDPVRAQSNALTLANQKQEYGARRQEIKDDQQARSVMKGVDPNNFGAVTSALSKIESPQLRMKMMAAAQHNASEQQDLQIRQLEHADKINDAIAGGLDDVVAHVEQMSKEGKEPKLIDAYAQAHALEAVTRLKQVHPEIAQALDKFVSDPKNLTAAGLQQMERESNFGQKALKERLAEARAKQSQDSADKRADQMDRRLDQGDRRADAAEQRANNPPKPKVPGGFEWDPDKEDTLRPISGGPKDPNSRPWSGREKVFSERIVTSANEASRAIKNITELPVGASSGVFGVGSSPGHGIFASGRDALRNKMSTQETQDYGTMLAGVKRNLATIETTGLTPSGALTEGFASLELREGDTQMTKLRKLAEMRQIVDAGLEVQLQDPAIPDSIKGVMKNVLSTVKEAVPYTQHDVTELQRQQQKNPDLTLEQLMSDKGLRQGTLPADGKDKRTPPPPSSAGGGAQPFSDPEKEKRYQEWKAKHPNG